MQYDTIEELMLELSLYPNKKLDILEDCAEKCKYGWFVVANDGNCALFDDNGDLDDINKVKYIHMNMISKDIEKIIIPDNITSIRDWAFLYCTNLTSVTISNSVTSIGDLAFFACRRLTSVMLPDSIMSIGESAFAFCSELESVTISNSMMFIKDWAFYKCLNLKELIFKNKTLEDVKSMKNYPFGIEDESIIRCKG